MTQANGNMNKEDFVRFMAKQHNITMKEAEKMLNSVTSSVIEAFRTGSNISIVGFGSFYIQHRSERTGRNPRTGEPMVITAYNQPCFKAGKLAKEACNSHIADKK